MATCPKCGKACKDDAKFCGNCGYCFAATCVKCGEPLKPGAKFCEKCGAKQVTVAEITPEELNPSGTLKQEGAFIHWNILPPQLAVRITMDDLAQSEDVRGIAIQEGVRALFFVNGKMVGELLSGHYPFKEMGHVEPGKIDAVKRFVNKIIQFFSAAARQRAEDAILHATSFEFVLIRSTEFPLAFDFDGIGTAGIRSTIGLSVVCKITNINEFYTSQLLDKKFVSFNLIKEQVDKVFRQQLTAGLQSFRPDQVNLANCAGTLLPVLQQAMSLSLANVTVDRIMLLSADRRELENVRQMEEELYVSEQELTQLSKRNDFLNRLQRVKNEQDLTEQQNDAEFERGKEKIYEEMALTQDEREKFDLLLDAQKQLREAKNDDDLANAMQVFRKSGLLRAQEMDNLAHQIQHNAEFRDLNDVQALAVATMQNQRALDEQKLEWETMVGNKRVENQFNRQRIADAYTDEREKHDADFADSRRRAEIEIDREEQQSQMDMLRQAQAIRMEREDAEHRRQMETSTSEHQFKMEEEKQKSDAANEEKRIYAGMSFEQIMAANPNITPEAAVALAKKFEAEAAAAQNDKSAQMAIDQRDQMVAFMQQQMAMMKDMSMAGISAGGAYKDALLAAKQDELKHTRDDAAANNKAVLDGMKETIKAVSDMRTPVAGGSQSAPSSSASSRRQELAEAITDAVFPRKKSASPSKNCPKCGAALGNGAIFCENCGESL